MLRFQYHEKKSMVIKKRRIHSQSKSKNRSKCRSKDQSQGLKRENNSMRRDQQQQQQQIQQKQQQQRRSLNRPIRLVYQRFWSLRHLAHSCSFKKKTFCQFMSLELFCIAGVWITCEEKPWIHRTLVKSLVVSPVVSPPYCCFVCLSSLCIEQYIFFLQ